MVPTSLDLRLGLVTHAQIQGVSFLEGKILHCLKESFLTSPGIVLFRGACPFYKCSSIHQVVAFFCLLVSQESWYVRTFV